MPPHHARPLFVFRQAQDERSWGPSAGSGRTDTPTGRRAASTGHLRLRSGRTDTGREAGGAPRSPSTPLRANGHFDRLSGESRNPGAAVRPIHSCGPSTSSGRTELGDLRRAQDRPFDRLRANGHRQGGGRRPQVTFDSAQGERTLRQAQGERIGGPSTDAQDERTPTGRRAAPNSVRPELVEGPHERSWAVPPQAAPPQVDRVGGH